MAPSRQENGLGFGVAPAKLCAMKPWFAALAALALASCASADPFAPRADVSRQIANDAASFNEAYGQAVSGQILLNILRSRDRLPRYYLSMTGIADSPSLRYQQDAGIGSIPLGSGASNWGIGSFGVSRETETRPAYAVQPFSAETLTRTAFEPTPPYVFQHYWDGGWPRDILLLVMVEQIEKTDARGHTTIYTNEANTIFNNCADGVDTGGCAYVREMRAVLATTERGPQTGIDRRHGRALCGLVGAYAPAHPVRPLAPRAGADCDPVFAMGGDTVRLRLRSMDDMVYYIGELMRAGMMRAEPGAPIEAQINVRAAGLRGGGQGVPLFRISPDSRSHRRVYAAQVQYGGDRFVAGPAIGRSCGEAAASGVCRDNAEEGDRSSSVLSLIAEILALNQSPEAIRAPSNRVIAE